ncbi:Uncharacterised protein [Vibrio cholerae]|nr:Uncharacterised protein [Vibrio cholerae]
MQFAGEMLLFIFLKQHGFVYQIFEILIRQTVFMQVDG